MQNYLDSETESETIFLDNFDIVSVSVMFVISRLKIDIPKGQNEKI